MTARSPRARPPAPIETVLQLHGAAVAILQRRVLNLLLKKKFFTEPCVSGSNFILSHT